MISLVIKWNMQVGRQHPEALVYSRTTRGQTVSSRSGSDFPVVRRSVGIAVSDAGNFHCHLLQARHSGLIGNCSSPIRSRPTVWGGRHTPICSVVFAALEITVCLRSLQRVIFVPLCLYEYNHTHGDSMGICVRWGWIWG